MKVNKIMDLLMDSLLIHSVKFHNALKWECLKFIDIDLMGIYSRAISVCEYLLIKSVWQSICQINTIDTRCFS